jgi:tetratricopeptide (TPR) repeat protein
MSSSVEKSLSQVRTLVRTNELKKAEQYLSRLVRSEDEHPNVFFELGNLYHLKGEIGRAIKSFKKTLDIDPSHTDASISLSVLLNDVGQYNEARRIFEDTDRRVKQGAAGSLIEDKHINKKFSLKHLELADLYLTYNRFDEALFELKKASALDPENLEFKLKLARIYSKKGFKSKAVEELLRLKNENPEFHEARVALGVLYFGLGNVLEAQTEWEKVLSKNPKNSEALTYLELSKNASEVSLS